MDEETATLVASRALWATTTNLPTTSNMDNSNTAGTCYGGGDIFWTFFGTLVCGALVAYLAWRLYKKYWNARKGMFSLFDFSGQQISISRWGRGWHSKNPQNFKDGFFKFINSPIRPAVMNGTKRIRCCVHTLLAVLPGSSSSSCVEYRYLFNSLTIKSANRYYII